MAHAFNSNRAAFYEALLTKLLEKKTRLAVLGNEHSGLFTALELSKYFSVIGYNLILDARKLQDQSTPENEDWTSTDNRQIVFSNYTKDLSGVSVYIICAPLKCNTSHQPDLRSIKAKTQIVGQVLKPGDTVIFQMASTPGLINNTFIPLLEQTARLTIHQDFEVGYTHETSNKKVDRAIYPVYSQIVAATHSDTAHFIADIFDMICDGELVITDSIQEAELAKLMRDVQFNLNRLFQQDIYRLAKKMQINLDRLMDKVLTPGSACTAREQTDSYQIYTQDLLRLYAFTLKNWKIDSSMNPPLT